MVLVLQNLGSLIGVRVLCDNFIGLHIRRGVNPSLSAKSDGGENVHDQVGPEHLDHIEGRMAKDATENGHVGDGEIDGELELQETLHVPVEVAAPH